MLHGRLRSRLLIALFPLALLHRLLLLLLLLLFVQLLQRRLSRLVL